MGDLVPILALECIPGDKHTISCESLLRFSPMVSPVMHRYDVTMHYFFVPNRILWNNWEKFITNTKLDDTQELPAFPYLTIQADNSKNPIGSLPDYLGIPYNLNQTNAQNIQVNALPFSAYQCVYNEYYRDQNLIAPIDYKVVDGNNDVGDQRLLTLRKRAWEHDYFTACLPWAQKGDSVQIPLGDVTLKDRFGFPDDYLPSGIIVNKLGQPTGDGQLIVNEQSAGYPGAMARVDDISGSINTSRYDPNGTLEVAPTNINDLRRAFRLQEWLEKAARGGSRYIEWIKTMFGVTSSDKRLQRPEYITGTKSPVVISEVLNTTGTQELPQGNMSGHAVSVNSGQYGSYYCEEHGFIIGIMSVMPKPAYFQGLDRFWSKIDDPTQYYFSSFANIGEQEVLNKELFAYSSIQDETFGYIPRYAEYRYMPNRVCANFRTDLDFWHQARIFDNAPNLNQNFVECYPDKRIFAVTQENVNSLYCQVYNKIQSVRPLPKYGTPSF